MKFKTIYSILFVSLSMILSACSENEDGGANVPDGATPSAEFKPNSLPAEPYAEDAIRIVAEDAAAPFYSLELMSDGYYLLTMSRPYGISAVSVKEDHGTVTVMRKRGAKTLRARAFKADDGTMTLGDGSQYGKFESLGNKRYRLSNGMTFDLMGATSSDRRISYANRDGSVSSVYISVSGSAAGMGTGSICRTWNLNSVEVWGYLNGAYMAHGKQVLNGGHVESSFDASMSGIERDDLLDDDNELCYKAVFTRAGTYLCFYLDGTAELALWRWNNEAQGILHYEDCLGNEDYDAEWDGFVTVRFAGSQMRTYEDYTDAEDGISSRMVVVTTLTAAM